MPFLSPNQQCQSTEGKCSLWNAGSNGQEYQFLLKGHEDLRQDERVMQLFGLVNSLLLSNPETLRRNLTYVRT